MILARETDATASWPFPSAFNQKAQSIAVATTGWSGRHTPDLLAVIAPERMVERCLFAKLAHAYQF